MQGCEKKFKELNIKNEFKNFRLSLALGGIENILFLLPQRRDST